MRQLFIVTLAGRRTNSIQEKRFVSAVVNISAFVKQNKKNLPNIPLKISNSYKFRFPSRLQEFDGITIINLPVCGILEVIVKERHNVRHKLYQ